MARTSHKRPKSQKTSTKKAAVPQNASKKTSPVRKQNATSKRVPRGQNATSTRKNSSAAEKEDSSDDEVTLSASPAKRTRSHTAADPVPNVSAPPLTQVASPEAVAVASPISAVAEPEMSDASSSSDSDDHPADPHATLSGESDDEATIKKTDKEDESTKMRRRIVKGGEHKYWMSETRQAVRDLKPGKDKKPFILYLPQTPEHTGAKILIENDIQLQELALTRGGTEEYSKTFAAFFNKHHRKAKSQLNRSVVLGITGEDSPFAMAMNVMSGKDGPMKLHPNVEHLENIEGLRSLLNSDKLYVDEVVHKLWVGLFASGIVSGTKAVAPSKTLDTIVDVNYEAHARFELINRLSYQGYKHGYTAEALTERAAGFRKLRKLVRKDRLHNLQDAEKKRLSLVDSPDCDVSKTQALASGGLADTTDESDNF